MAAFLDSPGVSRLWGRIKTIITNPMLSRISAVEAKATRTAVDLETLSSQVELLQLKYHTAVSGTTFNVNMTNLSGLRVTGVWNEQEGRIEF